MAEQSMSSDPSSYRPTMEGWTEYFKKLPSVLQHLAFKARQPSPDAAEYLRALPRPLMIGPMRGAFQINNQYYYIPCKFRLQHNEPIYYETKQHFVAEVRSEHPGLPGRSTSTTKFRVHKTTGEFDMLLPFIPVPLKLEDFTPRFFKELGRDLNYVHHEFLPHLNDYKDRVELVRQIRRNLYTNHLNQPSKPKFETDRDSIKAHQVELSVDIYAQLIFLLGSKKGGLQTPQRLAEAVRQAIVTGRWSAKRTSESVPLSEPRNGDAIHEAMRTIVSRQPGTKALLVRQRQLFPDAYGFLCAAGTSDGQDVGLKQPLCIYARVNLATRRLERQLWWRDSAGTVNKYWVPCNNVFSSHVDEKTEGPPLCHLGYLAAQTPYAAHDQGARHQLGVGQRKQFMTAVPAQLQAPNGPLKHQLMIGQVPLVQGHVTIEEPSGTNVLVALISDPMNQEDGIVINEAAVQRGLFRSLAFHRHKLPTASEDGGGQSSGAQRLRGNRGQDGGRGESEQDEARSGCHPPLPSDGRIQPPSQGSVESVSGAASQRPAVERVQSVAEARHSTGLFGSSCAGGSCAVYSGGASCGGEAEASRKRAVQEGEGGKRTRRPVEDYRDEGAGTPTIYGGEQAEVQSASAARSTRRRIDPEHAPYLQRNEGGTVWSEDQSSVTICTDTPLRVGDKLSNRHGQKGVVCEVRPAVDMPFIASGPMAGVVPDLLVNGAMAIPSRMTIGMLLEMAEVGPAHSPNPHGRRSLDAADSGGNFGTLRESGAGRQAGAFRDCHPQAAPGPSGELPAAWNAQCDKVQLDSLPASLCDGRTGQLLPGEIMMGMCWYGRMEQLAAGKAMVRTDKGPRDPLLGAPVRGRKAGGGLKWGTMEYNAAMAHGAVEVVRERTRDTCDPLAALYCSHCLIPSPTPACPACRRRCDRIETSRATELMLNELACQGVCAQLTLT